MHPSDGGGSRRAPRVRIRGGAARARSFWAVACILASAAAAQAATQPATPIGRWWVEWGAAQVEIRSCGAALCGEIVWLRSPFGDDGCPLRDDHNADDALRGREILGMELLGGLRPTPTEPDTWSGGVIYDPTSGRTYDALMTLDGSDRLDVRGYFGFRILGRTVTWRRVGSLGPCTR